MTPADFVERWHAFVRRWDDVRASDPVAAAALVRAVLSDGLTADAYTGLPPDDDTVAAAEAAVLGAAGDAFDATGYAAANSEELRATGLDALDHFCQKGWRWLRSPRRDFDVWWYWNEHLDPTRVEVNPLVHYVLHGRAAGLATRPGRAPVRPGAPRLDAGSRRACLFAAYDVDGVVDDYVVAYLTELARHADVYYLADCPMADGELAKLDGIVRGAWAAPHGRYDFGSYARLATELVGWEALEAYDEVLFANDSCYLLHPLDDVFARMDAQATDWWGLQATRADFSRDNGHDEPIPLADAKAMHPVEEDWDPYLRMHLSSYFVAFRRRVVADPGFRRRIEQVSRQEHKGLVILKYEIGLSDHLNNAGYDFAAYVDRLYPFHPLYTPDYFTLLERESFPLVKRLYLGENVKTPDLYLWKDRIRAVFPDAPVEMMERNLLRVTPADRIYKAHSIRTLPDGTIEDSRPVGKRAFRALDRNAPKFDHWWAFPVCAFDHTFAGNERAVFEEVRDDPAIKKIILTRSRRIGVTGENVVEVPLRSKEGQHYLARARQIFVKHGPFVNAHWPISTTAHNVINLWHGIPLKRFGTASLGLSPEVAQSNMFNNAGSRAVITSSAVDSLAMTSAFYPVGYTDLWPTGLPRNDFVVRPDERLPDDLRAAADRLRAEVAGRRLVLFLPTFKDGQDDSYYHFSDAEIARLGRWAEANDAVIGVREHMADSARTYSRLLAPLNPINVSSRRYPDLEVLYRVADALISDYSSCLVDFQLTGRPVISFAYDLDRYAHSERGLFYDLDEVLPGPVCRTFDDLADALDRVFDEPTPEQREEYEWRRRLFFDHLDDRASARVVRRVKSLYLGNVPLL
jgi:CDP-glycerol glycerophosphotransferase (TagB/SpsB family)